MKKRKSTNGPVYQGWPYSQQYNKGENICPKCGHTGGNITTSQVFHTIPQRGVIAIIKGIFILKYMCSHCSARWQDEYQLHYSTWEPFEPGKRAVTREDKKINPGEISGPGEGGE